LNPDDILIAEEFNHDVVIVNRMTGKLRVLYGRRGVEGTGDLLSVPLAAHYLPAGPYQQHIIIAEYTGDHRVLIVDKDTGKILWQCNDLVQPLDAIYWDDEHIMVSDVKGVFKIRLTDKAKVWDFDPQPHGIPFYMQKLLRPGVDSYGGDLLVSYWGPQEGRMVREVRTADKKITWAYGLHPKHGLGDVYDRVKTSGRAFRYGMQVDAACGAYTIICDERSRILCVNKFKELVWELGGANAESPEFHAPATPYLILPTYITNTRNGTLLVTDWGRNMIFEINPFSIPPRMNKDAYLFKDYQTTDTFEDSAIMESRGFNHKNIQIFNRHETASLEWRVLASHNANDWQTIFIPPSSLAPGQASYASISEPWNFIKTQVKSTIPDQSSKADVYIALQR
jgi:hypothetical protein